MKRPQVGHTEWFAQMQNRMAECERQLRGASTVTFGKVCDIDPNKSRAPGAVPSDADGFERLRMVNGVTNDDQNTIGPWIPPLHKNGNYREHEWPSPGSYGMTISVSNEEGVHNTGWLPLYFTQEPGKRVKNVAFVACHDRADQTRKCMEVIETKMTLNAQNPLSGAEPNTSTAQPGETDAIQSVVSGSHSTNSYHVKKPNDKKQHMHREGWDLRTQGSQVQINNRPQKITTIDRKDGTSTIRHQDNVSYNVHAFTNSDSAQKHHTATEYQTLVKDGQTSLPKIFKPLVDDPLPTGMGGGTNNKGGGSGQNWTHKRHLKGLHWIKSLDAAQNFLERTFTPGFARQITEKPGMGSRTTVTANGSKWDTTQTGSSAAITRMTPGKYLNNALQTSVQHAGLKMLLNSGGGLGISSGGKLSVAAGADLHLAGHLVKIGGPVLLFRQFIGWGNSTPGGGGGGAQPGGYNASQSGEPDIPPQESPPESPPPEEFSPPIEDSSPPEELTAFEETQVVDLFARLDLSLYLSGVS